MSVIAASALITAEVIKSLTILMNFIVETQSKS
jgi:hypothetical protein